MHVSSIVGAALTLASLATAVPTRLEARDGLPACARKNGGIHIVAIGGAGSETNDPPYGLLTSLVDKVMGNITGSTLSTVPYDHVLVQTDGGAVVPGAVQYLDGFLANYTAKCPGTKIAMLGYSAGAVITMSTLCQPLNTTKYHQVIANVLYADETRVPNESYNLGTCTGYGRNARNNAAQCEGWAPKLQSYCNANDPLCCITTGTDQANHYAYPMYDDDAVSFVLSQFQKSPYTRSKKHPS